MSHIAFELDALPLVPRVARAAGLQEATAAWGLLQLWEWCWREKTDKVTAVHLRGFFGLDPSEALEAFGFLAQAPEGWRVRGAARYLRIQEGRSKGGKAAAAAGNLKRGKKRSKPLQAAPAETSLLEAQLDTKPQLPPSSTPAAPQLDSRLSATSDERQATSVEKPAGRERPAVSKPPEPLPSAPNSTSMHAQLVKDLCDACPGYVFDGGRDGKAVKAMLGHSSPAEIVTRWRRALARSNFPTVRAVHELARNWGHFATDSPGVTQREAPVEYPNGYVKL